MKIFDLRNKRPTTDTSKQKQGKLTIKYTFNQLDTYLYFRVYFYCYEIWLMFLENKCAVYIFIWIIIHY